MKRIFKKNNYYILYSLVFIAVFMAAFSQFLLNDRSFVATTDSIKQHYNSLVYFGQYIRAILKTLFMQGELVIPTWDFSLILGSDILTTLHYYAIGDPLNLLYAAVPAAYSEYLYDFLIFFRLYLAGITFSIYCRRWNQNNLAVLCGTLVYVFCGYTLTLSVVHPFFANPMIYLPLLLLGIEKVYENKSPALFIIMIFISAISNFYFFYVLSLQIFIYAAVRFFFLFPEQRIRNLFLQLRNFIGYYCIAVLGACAIFLPVVMATLNTRRAQAKPTIDLFYGQSYLTRLLVSFLSTSSSGYSTSLNWGCIPLVLLFLLFLRKKGVFSQLKIFLGLCLLFISMPIFGSMFNGFSYVINRWTFGFSFFIGVLVVFMIGQLETISAKEWGLLMFLSTLYIMITLYTNNPLTKNSKTCLAFLLFCICIIGLVHLLKASKPVFCICCMALICINISINAYYLYSPNQQAYSNLFIKNGSVLVSITESGGAAIPEDAEPFYRYGESNTQQDITFNTSAINKKFSTCGYYSLMDSNVTDYYREILSSTGMSDTVIAGFDDRAIPQTLANTKYFVLTDDKNRYRPYGFHHKANTYTAKTEGGMMAGLTYCAWANDYFLPFGYTYDNFIHTEKWDQLNFLEKEEAMLQTCHIKDAENVTLTENSNLRFDNVKLPFEVECGEGIVYKNGRITVSEPGASLRIHFQGLPRSETYFNINNLRYEVLEKSGDIYPESAFLSVSMGKSQKLVRLYTERHMYYNGTHNFASNLGYRKKAPENMNIVFPLRGTYTFDELSVYALPMKNFESSINKLKENVLQNVELSTNGINGTIDLEKSKILCLTIPYSKGWKGYINGKEVPLLQTNTMYTGICLEPGHHEIRLRYHTPYLKTGILLSCLGIFSFISLLAYRKTKNP